MDEKKFITYELELQISHSPKYRRKVIYGKLRKRYR